MSRTKPTPGNGYLDGNGVSPYGARADHTHPLPEHTHPLPEHTHPVQDGVLMYMKLTVKPADWDAETLTATKTVTGMREGYFKTETEAEGVTITKSGDNIVFSVDETLPETDVVAYIING